MHTITVLLLGVSGNVSQGILKALRMSQLPLKIISGCVTNNSAGLYMSDKACISPLAVDPKFIDWVIQTAKTEQVSLIFSGVEVVLEQLALYQERIKEATGAIVVASPYNLLKIFNNKTETCKWLKEHNCNYPDFAEYSNQDSLEKLVKKHGFPLLAKPVHGKGSAGVQIIDSKSELTQLDNHDPLLIQQYLGDPSEEYTIGTFSDKEGCVVQYICFRREILHGTTAMALVSDNPLIRQEVEKIVSQIKPMGPCNIQLRIHNGVPICFEVNLRYSGTTPIRARFGCNDVESAIRHYLLEEKLEDRREQKYPETAVLRYWNEIYVPLDKIKKMNQNNCLEVQTDDTENAWIEDLQ